MAGDENVLDVLHRLRARYDRRVQEGERSAADLLRAIEQLIEEHEQRAAARSSRGTPPPA